MKIKIQMITEKMMFLKMPKRTSKTKVQEWQEAGREHQPA